MKKLVAIVVFFASIGCKTGKNNDNYLELNLEPKSNSSVSGKASFKEKNGVVTFKVTVKGLKPGIHAIHIHEKADCSSTDGSSAGGHWNPTFKKHGKWNEGEYHKGDIGNITADENGNASLTLSTSEWCLGCGDATKDVLNKSIIIHEKADDFVSQPTGNAGGRIACSGIIR